MLVDVPGGLGWPCFKHSIMVFGGHLYLQFLAWFAAGRRSRPFVFRPPNNTRFLIWLAKQLALPIMLRLVPKIAEVELNEQDLRRLGELKGERVILAPNHSGGREPYILFHLSKMLGGEFNYLTAKEVFDHSFPLGWLLQRLGAYSIIRGTPDRSSFRMTRQLIVEGKRWLVMFPEGVACGQNDTVIPFQQGIAQLAFWGYEDLVKQGELPPLYCLPIAIKYVYLRDMHEEIDRSLRRLERKLFSPSNPKPLTLFDRLRRVGEAVLSANEKANNVRPPREATLNERIQRMKELIVSRVAGTLGVSPHPDRSLLDRIRELFNAIDQIVYSEPEGTEYDRQLHSHRQQKVRELYNDLSKVLNFIALYDGYVRETLTSERFLDVLGLLELEVFGRGKIWGPRKAVLRVGNPVNLANYFQRYQADKRGTLDEITRLLESSVREMLRGLSSLTEPIEPGLQQPMLN
jgi:1-acyl-sn-glycerol-3-phosphate acyltransferase